MNISNHLERAARAAATLDTSLFALWQTTGTWTRANGVPKSLRRLPDLILDARTGAAKISAVLSVLKNSNHTVFSLDVSDIQPRLQRSALELADPLQKIGELMQRKDSKEFREAIGDEIGAADENAHTLAGTLFPSAVVGIDRINQLLWDLRRLRFREYEKAVCEALGTDGPAAHLLRDSRNKFEEVNSFLNGLVFQNVLAGELTRKLQAVHASMESVGASVAGDAPRLIRGFVGALKKTSLAVKRQLGSLRIPLFPPHAELEELRSMVASELYEGLTGHEKFALLNIGARMRHTRLDGGRTLLDAGFNIRVSKVFPDRIYFTATEELKEGIEMMAARSRFAKASAALHKFKGGSFKQRSSGNEEGMLQVSFGKPEGGQVDVDADLDLYGDPLRHVFGEVLVNHLSGKRTDQHRVWKILAKQGVNPIGGFKVVPGAS